MRKSFGMIKVSSIVSACDFLVFSGFSTSSVPVPGLGVNLSTDGKFVLDCFKASFVGSLIIICCFVLTIWVSVFSGL